MTRRPRLRGSTRLTDPTWSPRTTRGGASFAEGRARSPPRSLHDRGSGWEAGPPCLLGAGSKAWGGLPIARLENPSRVELQSNPSGGALDTCNRAWGGAITTRRPLYSDRLRGRSGIRQGSVERHYIRETGQPRSGWYSFRGGVPQQPDCQWQCLQGTQSRLLTLLDGIPAEPEFALGALAGPLPGPAGLPEATPRVPGVAEVVCRVLQRSKPTLVTKHARWSHTANRPHL